MGLFPNPCEQVFMKCSETTMLHVQLWGAGGGGGGTFWSPEQPSLLGCGGGGGAGGYSEGTIENPQTMYSFFLATGGEGGVGMDGKSAQTSTFGQNLLFAEGGSGGSSLIVSNNLTMSRGGYGGRAGGASAVVVGTGGAGENGFGISVDASTTGYFLGGSGGINSAGSSAGPILNSGRDLSVADYIAPGNFGWFRAMGGSGASLGIITNLMSESTVTATGGTGASGYLIISEYGKLKIPRTMVTAIVNPLFQLHGGRLLHSDGLSIISVDSFGSSISTNVYIVPQHAKILFICLWGAGGGGGGGQTSEFIGTTQCSGGGGGGSYVEGRISFPLQTQYEYYVARGGTGGIGFAAGQSANVSWFSNPAHLCAFGGGGGAIMNSTATAERASVASGGIGGLASGILVTNAFAGSPGGNGFAASGPGRLCQGGYGGSSGNKSGQTLSTALTQGFQNGADGVRYGAGGGGTCSKSPTTSTQELFGGNGSDGHLLVIAYG